MKFLQGNLLDAPTEALVNTVNTVGVMGKGIALMFKEAFPANFRAYEDACKKKQVRVGHMFVTENPTFEGPRWIINFPTKKHWRQPSKLEWIKEGLQDLKSVIRERNIRSIALPPLGAGNGGLDWNDVRPEIACALADLSDVDVLVYEPTDKYQNVAKCTGVEKLTPARALIAEMIRRYWVLGIECTYLEVQKLGWFLERTIDSLKIEDPLDLQFVADKYGPYSDRLRHLLDGLDGTYLRCDKRLSDAGPSDTIWFDDARRKHVDLFFQQDENRPFETVLDITAHRIDGFQSPLGMELLATVDWLIEREHCKPSLKGIQAGLKAWPAGRPAAERKLRLFDDRLIKLALDRITTPTPGTLSA
ncbi:O-acetyl-ADP-ribose deacetylase (regulator of RNase III) [Granulicella aggregans]|uniref:O-acetyl-ADP-ribose deacetylase (Regulator of RNase III) n=1 Tax=Granulicella aggregans TaxID=474949 RepID=A0A7W8E2Y6_9BACT|nr:macro domain-containing protein [Granulicella aggregans]MBB5057423.1 O-acetyl-ADP-ribose deacetylase (regulator of RNase III) [Granulicella aggregans]